MGSSPSFPPGAGWGLVCPIPLVDASHPPLLLVVDDDEPSRELLSQRLECRGYATRKAASGAEALVLIGQERFDVVLLDVEMPSMSGYEVLQRIRLEWSAGELPVIMITGRDRSADIVEALALGSNDYVVKPIDLAIILARIDTQLQRKRVEAQIRERAERDAAGQAIRFAGSFTDITEGKEADSLASLSSRVLFIDRLVRCIETARQQRHFSCAVLLLDIHGLKAVKDTHGYSMGDRLLIAAARRLEHRSRLSWTSGLMGAGRSALSDVGHTVARLDDDEFAVLLPGVRAVHEAIRVVEDIHSGFTEPVVLDGLEVYVSTNVGILASTAGYASPEDVLRDAGVALSMAKARGRSRYEVFEPEMRNRMLVRQKVESSLRPALERREFRLHYQPIVRLDRETLVGFEALLRWQHPERGLVPPDEFVPLAEEADLIVGIGRWVVREACRQLGAWRDMGLGTGHIRVSINLSSQEFQQSDLVEYIGEVLHEFGLDGHRIEVEITESTAMAHPELVVARLTQLRALGVSVCLDDFGSGHSSLAYLHQLPVDKVKIDRSFVARLFETGDGDSRPIVRAVLAMARDMGIEVVAEGVEEMGQFDILCGLSCPLAQGYLFARPADASEATSMLRDGLAGADWRMGQQSLLPRRESPTSHN